MLGDEPGHPFAHGVAPRDGHLQERFFVLDHGAEFGDVHETVAVYPGHLRVDLGNDETSAFGRGLDHFHRHPEAAKAVRVRG